MNLKKNNACKTSYGIIVWGVITTDLNLSKVVEKEVSADFGTIILISPIIPFDFSDYYEDELGKTLKRYWFVTEKLISLDKLIELKKYAIDIENKFTDQAHKRRINLDPGLLTLSNFVLATTKNYSHRIYLGKGIFAEITLIYRNRSFQSLDWTYPDYRQHIAFFNEVRNKFHERLVEMEFL